jgi:hypothetical protein
MTNDRQQQRTQPPAPRTKRMTLASITRESRPDPDRVFLYGIEKIGKTTFAACAPDVVFISTENGLAEIQPPPARFPEVRTFQDVLDAIETLTTEQHPYRTLAIDSLDWVAHMLNEEVRLRNNLTPEKFDAYGRGYKLALEDWRKLILALERLQTAKAMEVILIAHAEVKTIDPPDGEPYARYQPKMGGGGVAAALIKEWAKSVLFARHEYFVREGEEFARAKGVSTGKRIIYTQWTAAWDAGSRHALPPELPLDYESYAAARAAGQPASPDALRAEVQALVEQLDPTPEARAAIGVKLAACGDSARDLARLVNLLRERAGSRGNTTGPAVPAQEAA